MSQQYRDNLEKMPERNSVEADMPVIDISGLDDQTGNPRGITFMLAKADTKTLYYTYLIAVDFAAEDGTITLEFTSHVVTLKGVNLRMLLNQLVLQRVAVITCSDPRYNLLCEENTYQVNSIEVQAIG